MKPAKYIGLFLLCCSFISCNSNKEISLSLNMAENIMQARPDSALKILHTLNVKSIPSVKLQACYALLYAQALDMNYLPLPSDSLINIAVKYYNRRNNPKKLSWAYYYSGGVYAQKDSTVLAIQTYLKVKELLQRTQDNYLSGLVSNELALLYQQHRNYEQALILFRLSLSAFQRMDNVKNEGYVLAQIADIHYLSNSHIDSVQYYFDRAKEIAIERKDVDFLYTILASNAIVLRARKEYEQAKQLLLTTIQKYKQGVVPIECYPLLSRLYLDVQQTDSAKYYILAYFHSPSATPVQRAGALDIMRKIEASSGNWELAYDYAAQHKALSDSIQHKHSLDDIRLVETNLQKEKLNYEKVMMKQRSIRNITLLCIVFTLFIIALLKWLKRAAKENELKIAESFTEQYKPMKAYIHESFISTWKPEFFSAQFKKKPVFAKDIRFNQYIIDLFNNYCPGFTDLLKKYHANLNDSDIALVCLLYANLGQKYLSSVYKDSTIGAIYTRCSRLYKKLGIKINQKIPFSFRDRLHELLLKDLM